MIMTLITSDWHLDENIENAYRWNIFSSLKKAIQEYKIERIIFLGDLTEKKDRHSAQMLNGLRKEMIELVYVNNQEPIEFSFVIGDHDYVDRNCPFFELFGDYEKFSIVFAEPHWVDGTVYIPHGCKITPEELGNIHTVFLHDEIRGAWYENGYITDKGLFGELFLDEKVYAGHIHLPQKIGDNITYVGSPFPIDFCHHWVNYRCLLVEIDEDQIIRSEKDLYLNDLQKLKIFTKSYEEFEDLILGYNLYKNAWLDVEIQLKASELHLYRGIVSAIQESCQKNELILKRTSLKKLTSSLPKRKLQIQVKKKLTDN